MSDASAPASSKTGGASRPRWQSWRTMSRQTLFAYLMLVPTVGMLTVFTLYPLAQGLWMAFFKRGVVVSERVPSSWPKFVGFDNFIAIAQDPEFLATLLKTVGFVILAVPLLTITSLGLALLLKPMFRGVAFVRAVVFFPKMVSLLIIGIIWKWMFGYNSGVVNYALSLADIAPVPWLERDLMAQLAVVLVWVWANAGFYMMILIAGLGAIPDDLYEAAAIDAASPFRAFWKITLPLLQPTIALVVLLSSVEAFKVYELVVSLTSGGPGRSTVYLIQLIYETAFQKPNLAGVAAAQSVFLFIVLLALTVGQLRIQKGRA